jgi:phenylalanyl-tRNA synthetase alpha chain
MRNPNEILAQALPAIRGCQDLPALEQVKARFLGKQGELTELLKSLGGMSPDERKSAGARVNEAKQAVESALKIRREAIMESELERKLKEETLDVTLPGRGRGRGGLHPVTRTQERIQALFRSMGFEVAYGPEIETDFYNFTALNIPEDCCVRIHRRYRYITCNHTNRHSASSRLGGYIAAIPMLRIPPCSTRWKAYGWMSRFPSPTLKVCWRISCAASLSRMT